MADLSEIYGADPFAGMTPEQFLEMAQGQGLGKAPVSTEFPGLGGDYSDMFGIDSFLEDRAKDSFRGVDAGVLERQAAAGSEGAAAEIANRSGEFGGIEPLVDIAQELKSPAIDMSGLDFEYQANTEVDDIATTLAALDIMPSTVKGGRGTVVEKPRDRESETMTQENIEAASMAAMNDYIESVRGVGPEISPVKDIADYRKKFAEATGLDISGKVDKSHALMTFGLALMQNKAGKGFNVGKMLTSVGEAGDKALPALQKARELTRLNEIAAGKYALEAKSADETKARAANEKAMERTDYFVVPKTDNVRGLLANLAEGAGKRKSLSKYELNELKQNPEFSAQFEVLPGSVWSSVVAEALKTPEAKEYFLPKSRTVPIMASDDGTALIEIDIFEADPNKGKAGQTQPSSVKEVDRAYRSLRTSFEKNQKDREKFVSLQTDINNGSVNVFAAIGDKFQGFASALGVKTEGLNADARMRAILKELQAQSAKGILGEIKGTSDFERQMVREIVGDKNFFTDPNELEFKIANVYGKVVDAQENRILEGLQTLDDYSNNKVSDYFGDGELTQEERASMNSDLEALLGVKK
jgi:hypothetical protein